jgi:hypothetical protein
LHVFLNLCELVARFSDGFFAHPACHDLGPTTAFQIGSGRQLVGVATNYFSIDILPVILARAELPWYLEIDVFILFLSFYCSRCLDWKASNA